MTTNVLGPVVISGCGFVGARGVGKAALTATFATAEPPMVAVDRTAGYHRDGARLAALVPDEVWLEILPARLARRMSRPSRLGVVAARVALAEAAASTPTVESSAVVTSTSFGPSSYTEELLRQIFHDAPASASPSLFTEAVANAPAAQIALDLQARGPNVTITQREAGALFALAEAHAVVAKGRAERAVVAAVDEMNPLLHAALDRFGVLAGRHGLERAGRPFARSRDGLTAAEGALALVLEPEAVAAARGVQGLARLRAFVGAFDPRATAFGYGPDGSVVARALRRGLERQGLKIDDIDAVVANASGSRRGDLFEAEILRKLFGDALPPVFAPKAFTGEHGGAALAGALFLLGGGEIAPPADFDIDPAIGFAPASGGLAKPRAILVSTPAVGGAAAFAVLERP